MSVAVNSTRKTVEISWDPSGGETEPSPPEGFPSHPIYLPPYVDNTLPGDQPEIDNSLPGDQPEIDNALPGDQPRPSHPIYLPPYVDNALPQPQPQPEHPIVLPPEIEEGIPPEKLEALKDFLFGNLPPYTGGPEYPAPVARSGQVEAVQVFAQGQGGDWSNTAVMPNDGLAALTYPKDFKGESYVEVRALDGSLVDSGTISIS